MLCKNVTDTELGLSLNQPTTEKIIDIGRRYPRLGAWEMFAMTDASIALFQKRLDSTSDFTWEGCGAKGFQTTSHSLLPPDTMDFVSRFVPSLKSTRLKARKKPAPSNNDTKSVKISTVVRPPETYQAYPHEGATIVLKYDLTFNMCIDRADSTCAVD